MFGLTVCLGRFGPHRMLDLFSFYRIRDNVSSEGPGLPYPSHLPHAPLLLPRDVSVLLSAAPNPFHNTGQMSHKDQTDKVQKVTARKKFHKYL